MATLDHAAPVPGVPAHHLLHAVRLGTVTTICAAAAIAGSALDGMLVALVAAYLVGLALLVGVALTGEVVNGARRWLHVGVTRIQPSELMRIAVPLMLAWYFDRYESALRLRNFVFAALLLIVPVGLIARQPDLGTSVLILASGGYALFLAGLSWRVIGSMVNTWVGMMNDPEAQRLMALQQKAGISSRYADLFKKLQLAPDQLEQFKAELLEKQTSRQDALLAAAQQGINPMQNPQEFRKLEESIQSDIDKQIKTTIGDSAFADYQTFQATAGQRGVVNQLQQSLSYTEAPLTPAQSDQVTQILATTGTPKIGPDGAPVPSKNNSRVTDATVAQAQTVLVPRQVQALQEIQQQQQAGEQLQKIMRQNRNGGAPAGAAPPPKG